MPDADLTELVEIDPQRVDGVRSPASGLPILLMKAVNASGQVNEKPDISGAETVLTKLAQLIIAEAQEMAAGEWDEIRDIELLTQAAYLMQCFRNGEEMNAGMTKAQLESEVAKQAAELGVTIQFPENASKDTDMETPVTPEDKTPPAEAPEVSKPAEPVEKSAAELVQEEVAKAVSPLNEVIKGLRNEMAALKSTPIPGGPVVTVPTSQRTEGARAEALAKALYHERLAGQVNDRELTRYHEDKAKEARAAANG